MVCCGAFLRQQQSKWRVKPSTLASSFVEGDDAEMASPLTEVGAWHAGQNVCHMAYMAEVYV